MSDSPQVFSSWKSDELRLLVGFSLIALGSGLWMVLSREIDASSRGRMLVQVMVSASVILGLSIAFFDGVIVLDAKRRTIFKGVRCWRRIVLRKVWAFGDIRTVEVRRRFDDGQHHCWVGLITTNGVGLWLRSFLNEPTYGPSEDVMKFARELIDTIGIRDQIRVVS